MAEKAKDVQKFTWKIGDFSKLVKDSTPLYSDTFDAGGHRWRIGAYKKRYGAEFDGLFVFLSFVDWQTLPDDGSYSGAVSADFSLTVVDQVNGTSCLKRGSKHIFKRGEETWGWKHEMGTLQNPHRGFIVDDTLCVKAKISTVKTASDDDGPQDAIIVGSYWTQPRARSQAPHHHQPDESTIGQSSTHPLPQKTIQVDDNGGPLTPSAVQQTSRNLMAELSSIMADVNDDHGDNSSSKADQEQGSDDLLQQQREKLVGFLGMSLEDICEAKSLDQVETVALEVAGHATDPLQKMVLEDLVSRLADFKETVPGSLTTIETSHDVESSAARVTKEIEERLTGRKRKLSSLEAEVTMFGENVGKLEAEIQQLTARRDEAIERRNSSVIELEKTNQEVSKELEELKKHRGESKQAMEDRMRAKEKLAQANASWKLFKENLG